MVFDDEIKDVSQEETNEDVTSDELNEDSLNDEQNYETVIENSEETDEDTLDDNPQETSENEESDYSKKKKKEPRKVNLSTTIVISVICVLLALIIGAQACFVAIYSLYEKKYENFIIDYVNKVAEAQKQSDKDKEKDENLIADTIRELTKYYDENSIYDNQLYDKDKLDRLIKDYVILAGDKYATYYTKEEWAQEQKDSSGEGYGIGIYYIPEYDDDYNYIGLHVAHVMANSPALESGVLAGDIIVEADGVKADEDYDGVVAKLKGALHENINIVVNRQGELKALTVYRDNYEIETVIYRVIEENNTKIGYIRVLTFDSITVEQFRKALKYIVKEKCTSVVYDLRNNLGGSINTLISMLDDILPEGPVLYVLDSENNVKQEYKSSASRIVDLPAVVLVNGHTASCSEAFTSALKDYKVATVIGTHTFGKGTVLTGRYVSTGGVLYLTTMYYKTATSECFDEIGIEPDIVVETDYEGNLFLLEYEDDVQLQRAVEELSK